MNRQEAAKRRLKEMLPSSKPSGMKANPKTLFNPKAKLDHYQVQVIKPMRQLRKKR